MAKSKFLPEERSLLLTWLAAGYAGDTIRYYAHQRHWKIIPSDRMLTYYRKKWAEKIEAARTERHAAALTTGLALREERVTRLCEHADQLEKRKWIPDEHGRLHNEKAWRECLDQIAEETGSKKQPPLVGEMNVLVWDLPNPEPPKEGSSPTSASGPSPA